MSDITKVSRTLLEVGRVVRNSEDRIKSLTDQESLRLFELSTDRSFESVRNILQENLDISERHLQSLDNSLATSNSHLNALEERLTTFTRTITAINTTCEALARDLVNPIKRLGTSTKNVEETTQRLKQRT
ncbi:MAG: hypothetical protein M1814_006525 [Vezdaea aestivalis]|nr:MAG: hypothetical protein M1814_006525 [Vezdaea aestivalis]